MWVTELMNNQSSLSVVIPIYLRNQEDFNFLKRTLDSVAAQSFPPSEVILSNDSASNFDLQLKNLANLYQTLNIFIVKNLAKQGISTNTNNGISIAKSKYVQVLHQDDWLCDVDFYRDLEKKSFVTEDRYILLPWRRLDVFYHPNFDLTSLLGNNRFGGPSGLIFPSESLVFFDERLSMLCDVDFVVQLYKKFGRPKVFERVVLEYGVSDGQAQNHISQEQFVEELNVIFLKHRPNRWKILVIALLKYKPEDTYAMVKNLERLENSFLLGLFIKVVAVYSRVLSRFRRILT
jgi:glycosyltransferase involved in cell wall biosynthesis